MALIDRLIQTLRAQEEADDWHLERAEITSTTDAMNWLLRYRDEEDVAAWDDHGPTRRRKVAERLRWCRDRFTREWKERGGRES